MRCREILPVASTLSKALMPFSSPLAGNPMTAVLPVCWKRIVPMKFGSKSRDTNEDM